MTRPYSFTRWDVLKVMGLLLMFVDHAGHFYFEHEQWLRGVGRAAAPLFLFLAGFVPHYKYDRKLLALALLLSVVDWAVRGAPGTLNILWTILIIRLILHQLEQRGMLKLKLHEWVIGSLAMMVTIILVQYGAFGFLFALCGYVYKHRAHYKPNTPRLLLWFVIVTYGIAYALLSEFTLASTVVMTFSLLAMGALIEWFTKNPLGELPPLRALKPLSRYTAEIYVGHLMALILITGKTL